MTTIKILEKNIQLTTFPSAQSAESKNARS